MREKYQKNIIAFKSAKIKRAKEEKPNQKEVQRKDKPNHDTIIEK